MDNKETQMENAAVLQQTSTPTFDKMIIDIAVLRPGDNMCGIANQLILDSITTTYKLKSVPPVKSKGGGQKPGEPSPTLNGKVYPITLGVEGVYRSINAVNSDKLLEFQIETGTVEDPMSYCEDTPYGFKLSNIMYNIGPIYSVEPNKTNNITLKVDNGWKDIAHLLFVQRAFIVNKCGCRYVIFSFTLKNVGTSKARKILFKDILPEGLTLLNNSIYVQEGRTGRGMYKLSSKKYTITGRKIMASLDDIDVSEEVIVTLVCNLPNSTCIFETNVGALSYVGFQATKTTKTAMTRTLILTQLSNIKKISNL